jgi:plasmid maintenance system antidote protein VapI
MPRKLRWDKKYSPNLEVSPGDLETLGYNANAVTDEQMLHIARAICKSGDVWKAWWQAVKQAAAEAGVEKYKEED